MGCECEEGGGRGQGDQQQANASTGRNHHIETGWSVERVIGQGQLAIWREGQHHGLGECLAEEMQDNPQQDETRHAATSLRRIDEQSEQSHQQAEGEPTTPSKVARTGELDTIVVQNGVSTEELGEHAVTEIVEELGDDDAEGGCEN